MSTARLSRRPQEASRIPLVAAGAVTGVFACLLVATAWMSDDAFITLRTIDNFVNGYGLRWNVAERVQAFTHPAWLIVLTPFYALTRDPFVTVMLLQIGISLAAVWLLCRSVARGAGQLLFVAGVLLSSKALVDFSTSGLENPLVHFLLIVLFLLSRSDVRRPALLVAVLAAVVLCRDDLILLAGPLVAATLVDWRPRWPRALAIGSAPLAAWKLFSLCYYGALVPNTALAKLSTGIPWPDLARQGLLYWAGTFAFDPVTPVVIAAAGVVLAVFFGRPGRWMAIGMACYLIYLIRVGGDFMSGRFFSPVLIWALAGLAGLPSSRVAIPGRAWAAVSGTLVLGGLLGARVPLISRANLSFRSSPQSYVEHWGVTDERSFYFSMTGLVRRLGFAGGPAPSEWELAGRAIRARAAERPVIQASNVGIFGFFAGPAVHVIDRNALCDPLLARLPSKVPWRIGHFTRTVPDGYVETWRTGANVLEPQDVRALYDGVRVVVQGPIWTWERLRLVLRFAAGRPIRRL